jgi:hypothetical protein
MSSWLSFSKKQNERERTGQEKQEIDRTACISKQSRFYLSRTARVVLSSLLLVESLLPISAETQKGKDFKNQMVNNIGVVNMANSGGMKIKGKYEQGIENIIRTIIESHDLSDKIRGAIALYSALPSIPEKDRKQILNDLINAGFAVNNWDGYTKLNFIRGLYDKLYKDLKGSLSKEDLKFIAQVDKEIDKINKMTEENITRYNMPEKAANLLRDAAECFFTEWKFFYLIARSNYDLDSLNAMRAAFEKGESFNVAEMMGGYGYGFNYYLVARAEDTQVGIVNKNLKAIEQKMIAEGKKPNEVKIYIDWIKLASESKYSDGNPFSGTDAPYSEKCRGKYCYEIKEKDGTIKIYEDYAEKMLKLFENHLYKSQPQPPQFDFNKLHHPGIDPQHGPTMPDAVIAYFYGSVKVEVYNRVAQLYNKYPLIGYLLPDTLSDINKIIVSAFNDYISDPANLGKRKNLLLSLNSAMSYLKNLEIVLPKIYDHVNKFIPTIEEVNKELKKKKPNLTVLSKLGYNETVINDISNWVKNGDISIQALDEKDITKLKTSIIKAVLQSTLPGMSKQKELNINNPLFRSIYIDNEEDVNVTMSEKDAEKLVGKKFDSMTLCLNNVLVAEYQNKPEYSVGTDSLHMDNIKITIYKFTPSKSPSKGNFSIDPNNNANIIISPIYSSPLDVNRSPESDQLNFNRSWFDPNYLVKAGWKQEKKGGDYIRDKSIISFGNPTFIRYIPYYPFIVFNAARPYEWHISNDKGDLYVSVIMSPPSSRKVSFQVKPGEKVGFFPAGSKTSSAVYVPRKNVMIVPLIPSSTEKHTLNNISTNQGAFDSVAANFNVDPKLLVRMYNTSKELEASIKNGDPNVNDKFNSLINDYRTFAGKVYETVKNDVSVPQEAKDFINKFSKGEESDLNKLIDNLMKVPYQYGLGAMFESDSRYVYNVREDINFQVHKISFGKPINLKLFDLSAYLIGNEIRTRETDGEEIRRVHNPDGTSKIVTNPWHIKREWSSDLYGLSFNVNRKKKEIGEINIISGKKQKIDGEKLRRTFMASYTGFGHGIINEAFDNAYNVLQTVGRNIAYSYSRFDLNGKLFEYHELGIFGFHTPLPGNLLSKLLFGKRYSPVVDIYFDLLFYFDKIEGIKPNIEGANKIGTLLDFGPVETSIHYNRRTGTKAIIEGDISGITGINSRIGFWGGWPEFISLKRVPSWGVFFIIEILGGGKVVEKNQ